MSGVENNTGLAVQQLNSYIYSLSTDVYSSVVAPLLKSTPITDATAPMLLAKIKVAVTVAQNSPNKVAQEVHNYYQNRLNRTNATLDSRKATYDELQARLKGTKEDNSNYTRLVSEVNLAQGSVETWTEFANTAERQLAQADLMIKAQTGFDFLG